MNQELDNKLFFKLEDWRLRLHFKRVEAILQNRDVSHLSPVLQAQREHYLKLLHDYAGRGIFPRDYEKPNYSPCFIDPDGRECAVAHLVMSDGHEELVKNIVNVANYAYVPEMKFPELQDWAAQAGFSEDELALIQPGYWFEFDDTLMLILIPLWTAGILTVTHNFQNAKKQMGCSLLTFTSIIALILVLIGVISFVFAADANDISTHLDVPETLRRQASSDVISYLFTSFMSLAIGLCTGGISFYRLREFLLTRAAMKRKRSK